MRVAANGNQCWNPLAKTLPQTFVATKDLLWSMNRKPDCSSSMQPRNSLLNSPRISREFSGITGQSYKWRVCFPGCSPGYVTLGGGFALPSFHPCLSAVPNSSPNYTTWKHAWRSHILIQFQNHTLFYALKQILSQAKYAAEHREIIRCFRSETWFSLST